MRLRVRLAFMLVVVSVVAGGAARTGTAQPAGTSASGAAGDQAAEVARLKDEIERLKALMPDQSHVMKDVAYHFSNLWFAGQAQNWPLAGFYLNEHALSSQMGDTGPTRAPDHERRPRSSGHPRWPRPLAAGDPPEDDRGTR